MSKKITGFNEMSKQLSVFQKKVKNLSNQKEISFEVLFSDNFMQQHTNCSTMKDFFDKSPFEFNTTEEFEAIPQKDVDQYTKENSKFGSWQEMVDMAFELYVSKQLGF